ncbi:hypothetical protein VKT23_002474 [Stygiomarasmius scandens]|uniref:MARVEL domain-containing protein n=1 Tax=Marasmiellus scandens TaxID=2682957 RepID=A0ABR1K2J7_9AGAR
MAFVSGLRIGILSTLILFALVVLGLDAHLISLSEEFFDLFVAFEGLGVASAVLTILTVPVMIIVDFVRRGAFTSMVVVELVWLGILWVLWLATGAKTVDDFNILYPVGCDTLSEFTRSTTLISACREMQAVTAFSFLSWAVLMIYWVTLLIASIVALSRGNSRVWFSSAGEMSNEKQNATNATMMQPQYGMQQA